MIYSIYVYELTLIKIRIIDFEVFIKSNYNIYKKRQYGEGK